MTGEKLLSRRDLRRRGWTDRVISEFLPEPDEIRDNPHIWSAPPMKLYRPLRVKALEMKPEVQAAMQVAAKRKTAAGKAIITKRCRMIDRVTEAPAPDLSALTQAEIILAVLERGAVDVLSDRLAVYRQELTTSCKRAGIPDVDSAVMMKLLDVISQAQTWLAGECSRRKERLKA